MRTMNDGPSIQKIREAAAKHGVDPRSVAKALAGGNVRGLAGERVQQALRELQTSPPESGKAA